MAPESSFAEFMARLQAGDDTAATRVFQRYAQRLIALARSRLDARLRAKVDPDLASVRDKDTLAKLPAEQRELWLKLWAEVAALVAKTRSITQ